MNINLKNYLRKGIIVTTLVLGMVLSNARGLESKLSASDSSEQTTLQTSQKQEIKKESPAYDLIKAATIEDCAGFVNECKDNTPFKQQIEKHGFQETIDNLVRTKTYSIDLAKKYATDANEIPAEEFIRISREIGQNDIKFYKGHTDPIDPLVVKKRAETLKIVVAKHRRVLERQNSDPNSSAKTYEQLIRANFTEQEYTEYCNKMADAMDNYYDALGKTLGWKIVIGKPDLDKMKKTSRVNYFKEKDRIYNPNSLK